MSAATPSTPSTPGDAVLCPRCSAGFECGVSNGGCWCKGVALNDATRADLALFYNGCLCPACLHEIEDNRPRPLGAWAFLKMNLKRRRG